MAGRLIIFSVCFVAILASFALSSQAQVIGEEAELDRLRMKAEEAMGNEDAEGAAMSMGRAALMAAHLAKRQPDQASQQMFQAAEHLYRSQEHGYRALALFRRAGGELPASAGVCGSLQLGQLELTHAQAVLGQPDQPASKEAYHSRLKPIQQNAEDWAIVLSSMGAEFHCPG